jgi:hypothetical protein
MENEQGIYRIYKTPFERKVLHLCYEGLYLHLQFIFTSRIVGVCNIKLDIILVQSFFIS